MPLIIKREHSQLFTTSAIYLKLREIYFPKGIESQFLKELAETVTENLSKDVFDNIKGVSIELTGATLPKTYPELFNNDDLHIFKFYYKCHKMSFNPQFIEVHYDRTKTGFEVFFGLQTDFERVLSTNVC